MTELSIRSLAPAVDNHRWGPRRIYLLIETSEWASVALFFNQPTSISTAAMTLLILMLYSTALFGVLDPLSQCRRNRAVPMTADGDIELQLFPTGPALRPDRSARRF
jgi:hypothetical protein